MKIGRTPDDAETRQREARFMTNSQLDRDILQHSDSGDFTRFRALLTDDCEWVNPVIQARGADEISRNVAGFFAAFPRRQHQEALTVESGETVAIEGRWVATYDSGRRVEAPFAAIMQIREGLVAAVRLYLDTAALLAQLNPAPVGEEGVSVTDDVLQQNKRLDRRWFTEVVSRGDLAAADEILSGDYRLHFPVLPSPSTGTATRAWSRSFEAASPTGSRRSKTSLPRMIALLPGFSAREPTSVSSRESRRPAATSLPAASASRESLMGGSWNLGRHTTPRDFSTSCEHPNNRRPSAMKGGFRLGVSRPADHVFDFLADLRNESLWNPRVRQLILVTPGPIAAGSAFRGSYQGLGTLQTTLTEYERPTRLGFRSEGPRADITGIFTLQPKGDGVSVELAADVRPRALLSLLTPLMTVPFRRQNAAAAARLKSVLDHGGLGARLR